MDPEQSEDEIVGSQEGGGESAPLMAEEPNENSVHNHPPESIEDVNIKRDDTTDTDVPKDNNVSKFSVRAADDRSVLMWLWVFFVCLIA